MTFDGELIEVGARAVMEWHAWLGSDPMTTEQYARMQTRVALTAMRAHRRSEVCETCGGTGKVKPTATREEQHAHLDAGTCDCHDSWDQCPCAEGGHPAGMTCGCCPLGTGLCGPRLCEPCSGSGRVTLPTPRLAVVEQLDQSGSWWLMPDKGGNILASDDTEGAT